MNPIFMNFGECKTSHSHKLLLTLTHKIVLRRDEKSVALTYLSIYYIWKI